MSPDEQEDNSLPARMARGVNQLDIDFSRFTLIGWLVALAALASGGAAGYVVYQIVLPAIKDHRAGPLAFGLTMVGVTTVTFQGLRMLAGWFGVPIVRALEDAP